MNNEISKEDLFRKIDRLKIKIFDTEDALKSAEIRIQELNKCNDYANEELDKYKNILKEIRRYVEKGLYRVDGSYILKILDRAGDDE